MLNGIDVSNHQGVIDWDSLKPKVDYAILRCGYGDNLASQDDTQFARNASECERLGIPYGVYLYSYANSVAHAQSEADHVLRLIAGKKLSYPVYYDLEDNNTTGKCSNDMIAEIAATFVRAMQNAGVLFGIYASKSWFTSKLTAACFDDWPRWVAQYYSSCTYTGAYEMWQYTSDGDLIPGHRCDMNYCYTDKYQPQGNYRGYLDGADAHTVTGWAYNGKDDTAVEVHIYVYNSEDVLLQGYPGIMANIYRPDLQLTEIGNGSHGFVFRLDFLAAFGVGTFKVKAFAINGSTNPQLDGECTVTVEAPPVVIPEPEPEPVPPVTEPEVTEPPTEIQTPTEPETPPQPITPDVTVPTEKPDEKPQETSNKPEKPKDVFSSTEKQQNADLQSNAKAGILALLRQLLQMVLEWLNK